MRIKTLSTNAQTLAFDKAGRLATTDVKLTLIPYYAWCHRGNGDMKVWLAQDLKATRPAEPATLASTSKVASSMNIPALSSINDRLVPKDGSDRSIPYAHWWPKKASTEWIKPGKVAWDWWNAWNISGVDFRAGINTETYKYYIDFAAANGIEYVILDEGWSEFLNIWKFHPNFRTCRAR